MNKNMIYTLMQNLINKKFYSTKEEVYEKLDVYFALNRIDDSEYAELALLTEELYFVEEPDVPLTDVEEPVTEPEEPVEDTEDVDAGFTHPETKEPVEDQTSEEQA